LTEYAVFDRCCRLGGGAHAMKFAISYNTAAYGTHPEAVIRIAQHAEACGFESFLVPEHLVLYPGATLGTFQVPPTTAVADPLELLSFVAGITDRLVLGTAVLLLPYRHPVVLAKQLATIDILSRGRLQMITVGLGTLDGEAAAVGVDFATRGRRADEAIDVLRKLWSGGADGVSHSGESSHSRTYVSSPSPVRLYCRSTSPDPRMQRLAAPAGWATGIFRAACSRRLNAPPNWTPCGPMPRAPVEIRPRCSTPAGDRSISPKHGWTLSNGRESTGSWSHLRSTACRCSWTTCLPSQRNICRHEQHDAPGSKPFTNGNDSPAA
jgi:hypothetical protein